MGIVLLQLISSDFRYTLTISILLQLFVLVRVTCNGSSTNQMKSERFPLTFHKSGYNQVSVSRTQTEPL